MKNGNPYFANGISTGREPFLANEILAVLNSTLRITSDNAGTGLDLSDPEDFERVAQAAWVVQQANDSQIIH